jgi:hypothetical protein
MFERKHESQIVSILYHGDAPFPADSLTLQYMILRQWWRDLMAADVNLLAGFAKSENRYLG